MYLSISSGKISKTPGYGHLDEDCGLLPFFRWLVLVTDLGVQPHREDWIPPLNAPFRNLRCVCVTNAGTANQSVLPAILAHHPFAKKEY